MDDIGHGIRSAGTPRQKQRGSSQGSIQSISALSANSMVGPAPTTKPPTPPQVTRTGSKGIYMFHFIIGEKLAKTRIDKLRILSSKFHLFFVL